MAYCALREVEIHRANVGNLTQDDRLVLEVQGNGRREADEIVVIPTSQKPVIREWVVDRLTLADHSDDAPLFVGLSNRNREGRLSTRATRAMVESRYQLAGVVGNRKTTHHLCHSAITNAIPARGFTNASPGYAMLLWATLFDQNRANLGQIE